MKIGITISLETISGYNPGQELPKNFGVLNLDDSVPVLRRFQQLQVSAVSRSSKRKTVASSAVALCIALAGTLSFAQSADAYYYPFRYFFGNTYNLAYSLPYLGLAMIGRGAPYNANPLYSAPSYFRRPLNMMYNGAISSGGSYGGGYPQGYSLEPYQDEEPMQQPRQRKRPYKPGQLGVDEVTHAQWAPPGQQMPPTSPAGTPVPPQGAAGAASAPGYAAQPNTVPPGAGNFTNPNLAHLQGGAPNTAGHATFAPASADGTPPLPPTVAGKNAPVMLAPNINSANPLERGSAMAAPLAQAFVHQVNSKFDGNMNNALFDPETRSWAKALGLINHEKLFGADLSDTRVQLMRQVLQDQSLDAISKLGAIKILLTAGANSATH